LKDGLRGQTPFTPAVGILLELNKRLHMIEEKGGVDAEVIEARDKARYFREKIKDLPFEICSNSLSNAVTPLHPTREGVDAHKIFEIIKDEYNVFVCPNGGEFASKIFRVGHIGNLDYKDYDKLIEIFKDLEKRNLI
jgi:aspartate aminotransferase-like enzyme